MCCLSRTLPDNFSESRITEDSSQGVRRNKYRTRRVGLNARSAARNYEEPTPPQRVAEIALKRKTPLGHRIRQRRAVRMVVRCNLRVAVDDLGDLLFGNGADDLVGNLAGFED
jgi:hypothetical protein